MSEPRISVIMSVFNGQDQVAKTIEGVLNQTFQDFEFIIINDSSKDNTNYILFQYAAKDSRVIVVNNKSNLGLTKSLNKGLEKAKAELIARIDCNDFWDRKKLERQYDFMQKNPEYVICGTQCKFVDEYGNFLGLSNFSENDGEIRKRFFTEQGVFVHTSVMFRKILSYRDFFKYSQDLDLYMRISFFGKLHCLPEPLTICSVGASGITVNSKYYQRQYQLICYKMFEERLKYQRDSIDCHRRIQIRNIMLEKRICDISMNFYRKYMQYRIQRRSPLVYLFFLCISMIIYPFFFIDYVRKIFKLLKITHSKYGGYLCFEK